MEREEVPVELRHEDVDFEQVPVNEADAPDEPAVQEREVDAPIIREESVVGTESRVTDEVRVNKNAETETHRVGDGVRLDAVEVDRAPPAQ